MKCEICKKDRKELATCKVCETRFCPVKDNPDDTPCGDAELMLCKYCIEAEKSIAGDLDDLNE